MNLLLSLLLSLACAQAPADPHLWLEEIEGPKALDWVRARNQNALKALGSDRLFKGLRKDIRKILLAEDRIPAPALRGEWVYNFWQDGKHVRGIWRRTSLAEYAKDKPRWELVLDLDDLSKREKENWVWKGADCLAPAYERCMLRLSRGGKDAAVLREFDARAKDFVKDGFVIPEAKSDASWKDADAIYVGTDRGAGTMTRSGYPRRSWLWKRGTPLADAPEVFAGQEGDVGVWSESFPRPEGTVNVLTRSITFWTHEYLLADGAATVRIPLPEDARLSGVYQGRALAVLRGDWAPAEKLFPAGSLVSVPLAGPAKAAELVYAPDERSSLESVSVGRDAVYLSLLENVNGKVLEGRRSASGWSFSALPLPANGAADVLSADPLGDRLLLAYESFLVPDSVYSYSAGEPLALLRRLPERFSPAGLGVSQFEAVSRDGTKVPYFLVRPSGASGPAPTLLYGYGGFEASMTPFYLETAGKAWLERGGAYALANIRGGGEFGPRWHKAALKTNRQRAFDDFAAVAEDLAKRGLAEPARLAIMGGSNGGLLMGASLTQRPELFGAVVIQVPLLDMLRYHKLLAGASWMGEYGDPDDAKEGAAIRAYSPYQNARPGTRYPPVFLFTSTKDDRVHPGHARKMTARLEELGQDVLYYENIEGGHSAAANLEQRVLRQSLEYSFLIRTLMGSARLIPGRH